jgi:hypothetical protein
MALILLGGRGSSQGHSLDSFHYTLPGNPLNELNGSLLPLATPANSQLWPTNSGQLARVGIVINQFIPLSCKMHFQLWPKISDTSTLGQSAKCTIASIDVGMAMDCIGRQHIGSRCAVTVLYVLLNHAPWCGLSFPSVVPADEAITPMVLGAEAKRPLADARSSLNKKKF